MSKIIKHLSNGEKGTGRGYVRRAALPTALMMLTLMIFSFMLPVSALAADDVKIDNMSVRVMPEYDDARVLAVLESVLSKDTKLPAKAKFLISKKYTDIEIGMACEVPEGQGHQCKVYKTVDVGDFQELSYNVETARNLFLEYYWNPFNKAKDNKREFTYEFKSPYPIGQLNIQIQEPLKGTNYKVEPDGGDVSTDQEGFKWHVYSFNDVKPDQVYSFNVAYNSGGVSKAKTDLAPAGQAGTADQPSNRTSVQLFLFFLVVLVAVGALAMYWRSQTVGTASVAKQVARPRSKTKGGKTKAPANKGGKSKFCSNCGSALEAGSKFCSECGSGVA